MDQGDTHRRLAVPGRRLLRASDGRPVATSTRLHAPRSDPCLLALYCDITSTPGRSLCHTVRPLSPTPPETNHALTHGQQLAHGGMGCATRSHAGSDHPLILMHRVLGTPSSLNLRSFPREGGGKISDRGGTICVLARTAPTAGGGREVYFFAIISCDQRQIHEAFSFPQVRQRLVVL